MNRGQLVCVGADFGTEFSVASLQRFIKMTLSPKLPWRPVNAPSLDAITSNYGDNFSLQVKYNCVRITILRKVVLYINGKEYIGFSLPEKERACIVFCYY